MAKSGDETDVVQSKAHENSASTSPIAGVLRMLSLAKNILENEYKDQLCASYVDECMLFLMLNDVGHHQHKSSEMVCETHKSITSLIRFLIYTQMEIAESVCDHHCVELLQRCILRLAQKYGVSHDDILDCARMM